MRCRTDEFMTHLMLKVTGNLFVPAYLARLIRNKVK